MRPLSRAAHVLQLLLLSGSAVALAGQDASAPAGCDEALARLASGANGYRARGDRCEGVYSRPVAGTTLFLASFTQIFDEYNPAAVDTIRIGWSAPAGSSVQLRAETIRRGRYYRMDTRREVGESGYAWPGRLLASERIGSAELGIVGTTRVRLGSQQLLVYLPLAVRAGGRERTCGDYLLKLAPGVRLAEVEVTLARLGEDGTPAAILRENLPLRLGFYPPERAIPVRLTRAELAEPGLYLLKVGARFPNSTRIASQEYFLQVPPSTACPD